MIESKHSKQSLIPSLEDIKDGLLKMILLTNLEEVKIYGKEYTSIAVLKLTSDLKSEKNKLTESQKQILKKLKEEAEKKQF